MIFTGCCRWLLVKNHCLHSDSREIQTERSFAPRGVVLRKECSHFSDAAQNATAGFLRVGCINQGNRPPVMPRYGVSSNSFLAIASASALHFLVSPRSHSARRPPITPIHDSHDQPDNECAQRRRSCAKIHDDDDHEQRNAKHCPDERADKCRGANGRENVAEGWVLRSHGKERAAYFRLKSQT